MVSLNASVKDSASRPQFMNLPLVHGRGKQQLPCKRSVTSFNKRQGTHLPATASSLSPDRKQANSAVAMACVPETNCVRTMALSVPMTAAMTCTTPASSSDLKSALLTSTTRTMLKLSIMNSSSRNRMQRPTKLRRRSGLSKCFWMRQMQRTSSSAALPRSPWP